MKQQTINDHIDQQASDLKRLAESKGKGITEVLRLKHKYMKRCVSLYYLGMHAIQYNDGTDAKLFDLSKKRKKFYINKLLTK